MRLEPAFGAIAPLPFHVMDTDIYAYAPTVLLGTVDKMAMIGHSPNTIARVFGMLGFAPWVREDIDASGRPRPGHGRLGHPRRPADPGGSDRWRDARANSAATIGPVYGNARVELFDPYPAIEVQDEAHLLEQSLGTFSGLFGSMLETALADLAPLLVLQCRPAGCRMAAPVERRSSRPRPPSRVRNARSRCSISDGWRRSLVPVRTCTNESFFARLQRPELTDVGREGLQDVEERTPTWRLYLRCRPTVGRTHQRQWLSCPPCT